MSCGIARRSVLGANATASFHSIWMDLARFRPPQWSREKKSIPMRNHLQCLLRGLAKIKEESDGCNLLYVCLYDTPTSRDCRKQI